jgi:uncharacterized membrane protein
MATKAKPARIAFELAVGGVFAALVCVATLAFKVDVPATKGYFNIGETVIYTAALLFGPFAGAFSGGVGAAVADLIVAPEFALGTLVVKGFEGAIVGFLGKKTIVQFSRRNWRIFTVLLGVIVGLLLASTGSVYYIGTVPLYLGYPLPENPTLTVFVPPELWYSLGGIVALLIIFMGLKIDPELGRAILSMVVGGLEMVFGYFLYEQLILGNTLAIVEVPVNIGQMIIGLVVALPVAKIVLRSLPQLKS